MRAARLALSGMAALLAGCPDRTIAILPVEQSAVEDKNIPVIINRDLDILFVIDKSPTMQDEQASLTANFGRFMQILSDVEGGLPNVHVGVISQDMGAGGHPITGCAGTGDNGRLLATPRVPGCTPPTGAFISDIADPDGARVRNYGGSLEETFSCIATLGDAGCGFEQHLGSLEAALFDNPQNQGFLRPDALLAIIIISDEDDCTARDTQLYNPSNTTAGPLADYRCFEWGWECDQGTMGRDAATYTNCRPREDSPYLRHPDALVERIKALKANPNKIVVSTIAGPSALSDPSVVLTTVTRETIDMVNVPRVRPSCTNGTQNAFPMPRLAYFASQFENNTFYSLCNDDLGGGLTQIAQMIRRIRGNPCFEANIATTDEDPDNPGTQLDCAVSTIEFGDETPIAACRMADANTPAADTPAPCWYVRENVEQCESYPTKLELVVWPPDLLAGADSRIHAQCTSR